MTVTVLRWADSPVYQELLAAIREDYPTAVAITLTPYEMGTITLEEPDE